MIIEDYRRAQIDLDFAKRKAKEVHDARLFALELTDKQRNQIKKISRYLTKNFYEFGDRDRILAFFEEVASDLDPSPDVENALGFLASVTEFLPKKGQPRKEALIGATEWLLLYYQHHYPDQMGIGWSVKEGGTQNYDSNLVAKLCAYLKEANILLYGKTYQTSSVANAATGVLKSARWKAIQESLTVI